MTRTSEVTVEQFLDAYDPKVRRLVEAARTCIRAAVPHATERLRPGWRLIGYNAPAYFAFISPERDHIRIGFEWGVMLTDPAQILTGTGRQVRYVVIRSGSDLKGKPLTLLLRAAAAIKPPVRTRTRRT